MSTIRSVRSASKRGNGDGGTSLIGSLVGVVAFLCFLLFAVQVTYDLYAKSAVTSAAFEAVRIAAGGDATDEASRSAAEQRARDVLGGYANRVTFSWSASPDVLSLRVQATNPSFLPTALRRPLGIDRIDRTVTARLERFR